MRWTCHPPGRSIRAPHSWHHVVGVYDPHDPRGASLLVYVDGEPGDRVPLATPSSSAAAAGAGAGAAAVRLWGPVGAAEGRGGGGGGGRGDSNPTAAAAAAAADDDDDDDWPLGFTIGGAPDWPTLRMDGEVDAVRVWGGAMTHAQVAAAMLDSWKVSSSSSPRRHFFTPATTPATTTGGGDGGDDSPSSSSSSSDAGARVEAGAEAGMGAGPGAGLKPAAGATVDGVSPSSPSSPSSSSPPPPPLLVGSWHLNEGGGGTFRDDGPDGRHGTFTAAPRAAGVGDGGGPEWIASEVRGTSIHLTF